MRSRFHCTYNQQELCEILRFLWQLTTTVTVLCTVKSRSLVSIYQQFIWTYGCTWVQQGDLFGRSHRLPSLLLLCTFFGWSGTPAPTSSAAALSCDLAHQPTGLPDTFFWNHVPPELPDLHFLILFTFTLAQKVLLRRFSTGCFAPTPAHHHLPWHAQSHVTPYTCTLLLPSAGSSTILVPLMTDENRWTLAVAVQQWSNCQVLMTSSWHFTDRI